MASNSPVGTSMSMVVLLRFARCTLMRPAQGSSTCTRHHTSVGSSLQTNVWRDDEEVAFKHVEQLMTRLVACSKAHSKDPLIAKRNHSGKAMKFGMCMQNSWHCLHSYIHELHNKTLTGFEVLARYQLFGRGHGAAWENSVHVHVNLYVHVCIYVYTYTCIYVFVVLYSEHSVWAHVCMCMYVCMMWQRQLMTR